MPAKISLIGQTIGKLKIIEQAPNKFSISGKPRVQWRCRCECGKETIVATNSLRSGRTVSCGCYGRTTWIKGVDSHITHGCARKASRTTEYNIWCGMIQRCTNSNCKDWHRYGAKGITVCERWLKFENFLVDMGERPKGKTLDRWPNRSGNYEPGNCRWATPSEQAINRNQGQKTSFTIRGITGSMSQLCRRFGIRMSTVCFRLKKGWSDNDAFCTKPNHQPSMTTDGSGIG